MESPSTTQVGWDRRRLLIGLAAVVLAAAVLITGLAYAAYSTITSASDRSDSRALASGTPTAAGRAPGRDAIAGRPMLRVTPADARPTTPSAVTPAVFVVPAAVRTGPGGVPSGFPRTPAGAVAQLAAIETTVLQGMSIPQTNDVYRRWALPGGVGVAGWELTRNVQAFLGTAEMSQAMNLATVVATPAAAQVKGVDGDDWLVACVLLEVRATITVESKMGYGYCERMQWHRGRWMIAPGAPAARAPSTWPGSDLSVRAGWRTWVDAGQE